MFNSNLSVNDQFKFKTSLEDYQEVFNDLYLECFELGIGILKTWLSPPYCEFLGHVHFVDAWVSHAVALNVSHYK